MRLRIHGSVLLTGPGVLHAWPERKFIKNIENRYDARLEGVIIYDRAKQKIVRWDMAALGDFSGRWFAGQQGWKEATPDAPMPLGFAFEIDQTAYDLPPERRRPRSFMHAYIFQAEEEHYWDPDRWLEDWKKRQPKSAHAVAVSALLRVMGIVLRSLSNPAIPPGTTKEPLSQEDNGCRKVGVTGWQLNFSGWLDYLVVGRTRVNRETPAGLRMLHAARIRGRFETSPMRSRNSSSSSARGCRLRSDNGRNMLCVEHSPFITLRLSMSAVTPRAKPSSGLYSSIFEGECRSRMPTFDAGR